MLKLQFLTCKKYSEEWPTVKNCNFSELHFFDCNFTVISLHIFAVYVLTTARIPTEFWILIEIIQGVRPEHYNSLGFFKNSAAICSIDNITTRGVER